MPHAKEDFWPYPEPERTRETRWHGHNRGYSRPRDLPCLVVRKVKPLRAIAGRRRHDAGMPWPELVRSPVEVPIVLLVTGAIGLTASLALTLDKIALLENPNAQLTCNFSVLVGCSTNLNSAQGAIFGFPNPLLGLVFWSAVSAIGVALLAGARLAGWFWALFHLGTAASLALVVWFIGQSVFVLRVLCPWCMATWAVTIPLFLVVTLHATRNGAIPVPAPLRRAAAATYAWIPLITLLSYVVVAVLAQWQLDVLALLVG